MAAVERYNAERVAPLARNLARALGPLCDSVEVAGSLRRGSPYVHDIDIVCIPRTRVDKADPDLFEHREETTVNLVVEMLREWEAEHRIEGLSVGRRIVKFRRARVPEVKTQIFFSTPETWGLDLVIRTGPKDLNIRLANRARDLGGSLHVDGRGIIIRGATARVATEVDVFKAVRLPFVEADRRDNFEGIWATEHRLTGLEWPYPDEYRGLDLAQIPTNALFNRAGELRESDLIGQAIRREIQRRKEQIG